MALVCSIVFTCIGVVLVVLGVVFGWAVFPSLVEDEIIKNVVLVEGTDQFERWETVPFPIDFKVYFFVIENPEEFINGGKANMTEVGPYIYDQYRWKEKIVSLDGHFEYRQRLKFVFNETKSYPLKDDTPILIYNVPFNAIIQAAEKLKILPLAAPFLESIFVGKTSMVLNTTVRDFLFDGVKICIKGRPLLACEAIKSQKPKTLHIDPDKTISIALFRHKQDYDDGLYRIKSGEDDIKDLGKIVLWEGKDKIDLWDDKQGTTCNMINGTDNTIFHPLLKRTDDLNVYNTDLCRSISTKFQKDVTHKGIKAFRYLAQEDILPAPYSRPPTDYTQCFCLGKTKGTQNDSQCLFDGVQELYPCFGENFNILSAFIRHMCVE